MKGNSFVRLSEVGDEILAPSKSIVSASIEIAQQGLHSGSCFSSYNKQSGVTVSPKKKLSPPHRKEITSGMTHLD